MRYLVGIDLGRRTVVAFTDLDAEGAGRAPRAHAVRSRAIRGNQAKSRHARCSLQPATIPPPANWLSTTSCCLAEHRTPGLESPRSNGALARELGSARGPSRNQRQSWLSHRSVGQTGERLKKSPKFRRCMRRQLSRSRAGCMELSLPAQPLHEREGVIVAVPAWLDQRAHAGGGTEWQEWRACGPDKGPAGSCYDWLSRHQDDLNRLLEGIRLLLVCDVGGGTSDFTLIKVEPGEPIPRLAFHGRSPDAGRRRTWTWHWPCPWPRAPS